MRDMKMAWRNLWRNKRRTLITVASIFFGVILSTVQSSLQEGTYESMIDNSVKIFTGHMQIHQHEYWEDKTINNSYALDEQLIEKLEALDGVVSAVPRLSSFTLIALGNNTKAGLLLGIDPEKEKKLTNVGQWVVKGDYLKQNDDGVLVSFNIAKHMKLEIGDTLILMSQGYHGASAAGLFPIRGILEFPSPTMNNLGVYMSLSAAQEFYSAPGLITETAMMMKSYDAMEEMKEEIEPILPEELSLMSWEEMTPELVQFIESDRGGAIINKGILYVIIAFGILGTIIMMVAERRREMGVMIAVGMQRTRLSKLLFWETIFIGLMGVLAGFAASIPLIAYWVHNPIKLSGEMAEIYIDYGFEPVMMAGYGFEVFFNQALTIFIFSLMISVYPLVKALRLNVIKAIRDL